MHHSSFSSAPVRASAGLVSHILLQDGDVPANALTVTWVEVAPGARHELHAHASEQVYVVIAGTGRMTVGDDERHVASGDLVLAPGGVTHGIVNVGDQPHVYVSAATPSFGVTDFYDDRSLPAPERS